MTDADVAQLERLPTLRRVNLAGTKVTSSATATFRQKHPSVIVETGDDE